jgi:hypothetical protein
MHSHNTQLVETVNSKYFRKLLKYKNFQIDAVYNLEKINGYNSYNNLIDINSIFSSSPAFMPVDRTGTANNPIKWANIRSWTPPAVKSSIDEAMYSIVQRLSDNNEKINVFWSGGIDSTAIVSAFLKNLQNKDQLRIVYSPWSYYEHPEYLNFLKKFDQVELIDQSGETYLDLDLDGFFISGDSGDEMHASIDESFLNQYGYDCLTSSWKDFFYQKNSNDQFIDFCEKYFSQAGFDVKNVLEARWFFYATCKVDSIFRAQTIPFLIANKNKTVSIRNIIGFFNCDEYEQYIYWNINNIMPSANYSSWKQMLKDFCFEFDGLEDWYRTKTKFHSIQFAQYAHKKIVLNDQRYIFILENGDLVRTKNLPFFSHREFENKYGKSLDYIFNDPDKL